MITIMIFILGISILTILWYRLKLKTDIFDPLIYILIPFFYIYVFQTFNSQKILVAYFSEDIVVKGLILACVGLAMVFWGYHSGWAEKLAFNLPQLPRRWPAGALAKYGMILVLIGIITQVIFIQKSGGVDIYFSQSRGAGDYAHNTGYLYHMKALIIPGLIILLAEDGFGKLTRLLTQKRQVKAREP
jgi:hypothetical protein